jgi:hypothetical protein
VPAQNDYYTVFTVLQQSVPWQARLMMLPGIILFGITAAFVAIIIQRRGRLSKSFIVLAVFVCAVFLLLAVYVFNAPGVQDMYARAKVAYLEGRYSTVEGTVSNFHPMPYSGHQDETFSVNGVKFSYSDYVLIPCFNNTASHGGPVHEGLRVRIAYSGNCILKLEVSRSR